MGVLFIECNETRVEESSSDIPVAKNVAISWTPDSVLCVWCFNGNINYSQYFWRCTRSLLTTELYMELSFDRKYIIYLWEMIGSLSKSMEFMVNESK